MLIRVKGRHDGVKQYLENGQKVGREFSRDQMDERVVLAGNLDVTDWLIQSIDVPDNVDRYLSITLSFKEDEVSREVLDDVVKACRSFVSAAYRPEEINFYAEAHLPRIKSYVDGKTGQLVERKPHIHVVIPKLNLLSGEKIEPLGFVKSNIRHIDALQEFLNARHGLASPKDNRRVTLTDASEMIARYRGDLFEKPHRELKQQLLDAVLDRRIENHDDFLALLAEHGQVRMRNAGRDNAYANVKPVDALRGINLKDHVFSRAFLELPTSEKLAKLAPEDWQVGQYETAGAARQPSADTAADLYHWFQQRAREARYLNSGTLTYQRYQDASPEDQQRMLNTFERDFYRQFDKTDHGNVIDERERSLRRIGRVFEFKPAAPGTPAGVSRDGRGSRQPVRGADAWRNAVWDGEPNLGATGSLAQAESLHRVRSMPSIVVAGDGDRGPMLLPDRSQVFVGIHESGGHRELRRPRHRQPGVRATGRVADTLISQSARDAREAGETATAQRDPGVAEIRQSLSARRLLAELAHSHGLQPDKYRIWTTKEGQERIRAGTRSFNVSDFLTKELNLPWREAQAILRGAYQRQLAAVAVETPPQNPRGVLWQAYIEVRDTAKLARRAAWAAQRATERARRTDIAAAYRAASQALRADLALSGPERRAQLSLARMTRVTQEQALRAAILAERGAFQVAHPRAFPFEDFLRERAGRGDEAALAALRRARQLPRAPEAPEPADSRWIRPGPTAERNEILFNAPRLSYQVHRNGDVTYRHDNLDVVEDRRDAVRVLQGDRLAIETGLRLAQARFGRSLTLQGSVAYQEEAARIAAEAGLYVEFTDARLNTLMQDRRAALVDERATGRPATPEPGDDSQPDIRTDGAPRRPSKGPSL